MARDGSKAQTGNRPARRVGQWLTTTAHDPLAGTIVALGFSQIVGWGTTVYAIGVLGGPIAADTGWSPGVVTGGLTVALLVSAALSMPAGRLFDRHGGRALMTAGSALAAASLAAIALASHPAVYLLAWACAGCALRLVLYDAAFASVVRMAPARGRRAISIVTLFGGLASSVLWPIGAMLEAHIGWRATMLVYAALNLAVAMPLHWFGLDPTRHAGTPKTAELHPSATDGPPPTLAVSTRPLVGRERTWGMILTGIVLSTSALVTGSIAVQMVGVLAFTGIEPRWAVALAACQGVVQTLARSVDLVFGRALHAITLGRLTVALLPLALLVLLLGGGTSGAVGFVVLFGAANGLATIVRAAVPLALFGPHGYGEVLGRLAVPIQIMSAAAPTLLALLTDAKGPAIAAATLTAIAVLAWLAMETLALWWRRIASTRD